MHMEQRNKNADICITVTGTLKGYDQLMNLVLDDVKEITRGMRRPSQPPLRSTPHPHLTPSHHLRALPAAAKKEL